MTQTTTVDLQQLAKEHFGFGSKDDRSSGQLCAGEASGRPGGHRAPWRAAPSAPLSLSTPGIIA